MVFFSLVATTPVATTALASGAKAAQPPTTPKRHNDDQVPDAREHARIIAYPRQSLGHSPTLFILFCAHPLNPRGAFSAEDSDERITSGT